MEQAAWFGIPWPEFNHGLIYTDTVKYATSASPQSLLDFYSLRYKESASKQGWLQRIRNGQIRVDGNVIVTSDSILRNGACLEYVRHPWREPEVPFRLQILFEDDHLVAVNKPSGLQVLPGGLFQQRTVLTQLQWRSHSNDKQATHGIAALHEKDLWKPSPVHRLGRGTSGVLLCAKSPAAKSQIAADLAAGTSASSRSRCEDDSEAERRITKTYRALASGIIPTDEVVVDQPIGKVRYAGVAGGLYMACETGAGGKPSRSRVTVLRRNLIDNQSLVEVQIFTGRPHQIRIHLAAIGHPLVGDPLYLAGGQPRPLSTTAISRNLEEDLDPADDGGYQRPSFALPGDTGYLLHAWHLSFIHPVTTERMNICAPPPPQLCAPHDDKIQLLGLDVEFDNGEKYSYSAEFLRVHSPAANSSRKSASGEVKVVSGRRHVAIMIAFDDLHNTGIYAWNFLHSLGELKFHRMRWYLQALEHEGLSRDPPRKK